MDDFEKYTFSTDKMDGKPMSHDVYSKGNGPVILIIQELPGIGVETLRLADKMVNAGFRVVLPHLFGPLGKVSFVGNVARLFCMRREFSLFAKHRTSPVVKWLAALCEDSRIRFNVDGIGVIGMCLSGNFALSLMADDAVLAAVASQPSLPVFAPGALHLSPEGITVIRDALDAKGAAMAFRFAGDKMCSKAKFQALETAFNGDKNRVELVELPGKDHSVLTMHYVDMKDSATDNALQQIIGYFDTRLTRTLSAPT